MIRFMNQSLDGLYYDQPEGFAENETDLYANAIVVSTSARVFQRLQAFHSRHEPELSGG